MSEALNPVDQLIPEAERFEQRMVAVIERGDAISWQSAEEVLIANKIAPPIPKSRQAAYIDERPELARAVDRLDGKIANRRQTVMEKEYGRAVDRVLFKTIGVLGDAFGAVLPEKENVIIYKPTVTEMSQLLDEGYPVSIIGFQRQGKTSLANALAQYRQEELLYVDFQMSSFGEYADGHTSPSQMASYFGGSRSDTMPLIEAYSRGELEEGLWPALDSYAEKRGERLMIVMDEVSTLLDLPESAQQQLRQEMDEIVSSNNLDLVIVEHMSKGQPVGELADLLPTGTKNFTVPLASRPEMFDFLRSYTANGQVTFKPEAVDQIHELTGGWLSLAAGVGQQVMKYTLDDRTKPRFIFDAADIRAWAEEYIPGNKSTRSDSIWQTLFNIVGNLSAADRRAVEMIAESSDGVATDTVPLDADNWVRRLNIVSISENKIRLNSELLQRLMPDVVSLLDF